MRPGKRPKEREVVELRSENVRFSFVFSSLCSTTRTVLFRYLLHTRLSLGAYAVSVFVASLPSSDHGSNCSRATTKSSVVPMTYFTELTIVSSVHSFTSESALLTSETRMTLDAVSIAVLILLLSTHDQIGRCHSFVAISPCSNCSGPKRLSCFKCHTHCPEILSSMCWGACVP